VRLVLLALALAVSLPVHAQEKEKAKKKQAKQVVHKKASPEQIRKFNELQKKQQK
jgi:hypothetical protein